MHADPKEGPMHTQHEELIVDAAALDDLALEEPTDVRWWRSLRCWTGSRSMSVWHLERRRL